MTIWNDQSLMAKKEKQIRQEKLYDDWKRKRDTREDSESGLKKSDDKITSLPRQQQRVQEPSSLSDQAEAQRRKNREKYPEIAAFVDECRRVFGEDVKVISITPHKDQATPVSDAKDD